MMSLLWNGDGKFLRMGRYIGALIDVEGIKTLLYRLWPTIIIIPCIISQGSSNVDLLPLHGKDHLGPPAASTLGLLFANSFGFSTIPWAGINTRKSISIYLS
jgi:hypothetical protein